MRIVYTESFPEAAADATATWRLIRKIVDDRLAAEILKQIRSENQSEIA